MLLYFLSFATLFAAELCGNFHALATVKGNAQIAALTGALSSALWCVKIMIIVNQPLTILTAFIGAYFGSLVAWKMDNYKAKGKG